MECGPGEQPDSHTSCEQCPSSTWSGTTSNGPCGLCAGGNSASGNIGSTSFLEACIPCLLGEWSAPGSQACSSCSGLVSASHDHCIIPIFANTTDLQSVYYSAISGDLILLHPGSEFAPNSAQNCFGVSSLPAAFCLTSDVSISCVDTGAQCTLNGKNLRRVMTIYEADTELAGLILKNGDSDGFGGVYVGKSVATFYKCSWLSNWANPPIGVGGGLYVFVSSVKLVESYFEGNTASKGGAIYVGTSSTLDVYSTTFLNNYAMADGSGNDIYRVLGAVDILETCPPGFDGSLLIKGSSLSNGGGTIEGSEYSYSGCRVCAFGSHSATAGTSECTYCSAGKVILDDGVDPSMHLGSDHCSLCAVGECDCDPGSVVTPQLTCGVCPEGKHSDFPGSLACTPCLEGHYSDKTGSSSIDECQACPAQFDFSPSSSTSLSSCFNIHQNIFSVSKAKNGIIGYNPDKKEHEAVVVSGGLLDNPVDVVFVNLTKFLVSSQGNGKIVELTDDGEHVGDFATGIVGVGSMALIVDLDFLAVAAGDAGVLFFKNEEGLNNGALTPANATATLSFNNPIMFLSHGENPDEILVTDGNNNVFRRCVPTSECHSNRKMKLAKGFSGIILDIALLKNESSYLIAEDRGTGGSSVWKCPLNPNTSIDVGSIETDNTGNAVVSDSQCTIFQGEISMLASGIAVDDEAKLVYFSDATGNKILVFTFRGKFLRRMEEGFGDLLGPSLMTIRPGVFATLSTFTKSFFSDEVTAGTPASFPLQLKTRNDLPIDYNISTAELGRVRIAATGMISLPSGDKAPITLEGAVEATYGGEVVASIDLETAGSWVVEITVGKTNKQRLLGSPFVLTVKPGDTDPMSCTTSFTNRLVVGEMFEAAISTSDRYGNPTSHATAMAGTKVSYLLLKLVHQLLSRLLAKNSF